MRFVSIRDFTGVDELQQISNRCKWCGKPEVSFFWSGKKGQYCSFRCNAGGNYPGSVLLSILASGITTILVLVFVIVQGRNPYTPIPSFFGVILAVPVILSVMFIYMTFVGRMLTKERQESIR